MKLIPDVSNFAENMGKRNANPKSTIHSLELVITMLIFVGIGRLLDIGLNTAPVFTLNFLVFGAAGTFASAFYRFNYASKQLEKDKVWTRKLESKKIETIEEEDGLVVPKGYGDKDG